MDYRQYIDDRLFMIIDADASDSLTPQRSKSVLLPCNQEATYSL